MTIEHIMPQNDRLNDDWKAMLGSDWKTVHPKYLHTIGNLTITGYNSEMSDKPFMEKMSMKGGFRQTACRLNEYIVLQNTWNGVKIEERAELLAAKALEIWQYPSLTPEQLAPYVHDKGGRAEIQPQNLQAESIDQDVFREARHRNYESFFVSEKGV